MPVSPSHRTPPCVYTRVCEVYGCWSCSHLTLPAGTGRAQGCACEHVLCMWACGHAPLRGHTSVRAPLGVCAHSGAWACICRGAQPHLGRHLCVHTPVLVLTPPCAHLPVPVHTPLCLCTPPCSCAHPSVLVLPPLCACARTPVHTPLCLCTPPVAVHTPLLVFTPLCACARPCVLLHPPRACAHSSVLLHTRVCSHSQPCACAHPL